MKQNGKNEGGEHWILKIWPKIYFHLKSNKLATTILKFGKSKQIAQFYYKRKKKHNV